MAAVNRGPSVALVVPAHLDCGTLRRCVAAVARLAPAADETVFVVDGDDEELMRLLSDVSDRVVVQRTRSGPARARNTGVDSTTADVVFFVDADVELRPDAVAQVRRYFAAHPEVAAIIGSYDDDPGTSGVVGRYKNLLNHYVHQRAKVEGSTFWGALGAIRRDAFVAVGGFDEVAYPRPAIEDIELGYRLRSAGYTIHVVKALQAKHLKRWHPRLLLKADVVDRAVPWSELTLRAGFRDDLNISRLQRAKVAIAVVWSLALPVAPFSRAARRIALVGVSALALLDAPLLGFFARRQDPWFACRAAAWHWFSYLYSAFAFAIALARVVRRRGGDAPPV